MPPNHPRDMACVIYWRHYLCVCAQNTLKNVEEECTHLQLMYQSSQDELEQLVERSEEHIQEIRELNDKFQVRLTMSSVTRLQVHCHL